MQAIWDQCFVQHFNIKGDLWPCYLEPKPAGTQTLRPFDWAHIPSPSTKRALASKYHCPGPDAHCTDPLYYIRACEVPVPGTELTISYVNMDPSQFGQFVGFLCGAHTLGYRGRDGMDYAIIDGWLGPPK